MDRINQVYHGRAEAACYQMIACEIRDLMSKNYTQLAADSDELSRYAAENLSKGKGRN